MLNDKTLNIMQECAGIDMSNYNHISEQNIDSDIEKFFSECTEMPEEFMYRVEDIPVQERVTSIGTENYVDFNDIYNLSECCDCTIKEALDKVCQLEENISAGMNLSNTYLVFDEKASILKSLKKKGKDEKEKIKKTIDDIKEKGIKVATKNSTSNTKCKKCGKKKCECK